MYFKTVMVLAVILLLYYVVMIALDIQKQKAQEAASDKKDSETDIDISEEASSFQPTYISRENPNGFQTTDSDMSSLTPENSQQKEEEEEEVPESIYRRPDYREATMTDGLLVEEILAEVDRMAETGESDLNTVVHVWEGVA